MMTERQQPIAILLMAMGGPDCLKNVEPYLQEVRGGRPTPPELVEEIRERYRVTGGCSPVLDITREVAGRLEDRLNQLGGPSHRVYVGLRHWHPFIKETFVELLRDRPEQVIAICMAPQYSSLSIGAYIRKVEEARASLGADCPVGYVKSWHRHPRLVAAIAENIEASLRNFPAERRGTVPILFTAHSLPERILEMKDPYPEEVQGTMDAVCALVNQPVVRLAYQSQGRTGEKWLGPPVEAVVEELYAAGHRDLLVAPIGFLCDHVEVLFDLDIELKHVAAAKGMRLERIPMLNTSPALVETLVSVVQDHHAVPAA